MKKALHITCQHIFDVCARTKFKYKFWNVRYISHIDIPYTTSREPLYVCWLAIGFLYVFLTLCIICLIFWISAQRPIGRKIHSNVGGNCCWVKNLQIIFQNTNLNCTYSTSWNGFWCKLKSFNLQEKNFFFLLYRYFPNQTNFIDIQLNVRMRDSNDDITYLTIDLSYQFIISISIKIVEFY